MKHNFKMLGWGKVLACSLIVLASLCFVFVLTKLNTKTYPSEASLKKELIHHEALTPLSNQVNDYLDNDSEQDPFRLDFSLVDTTTLGTYQGIIENNTKRFVVEIHVVDTTAPLLSIKQDLPLQFEIGKTSETNLHQALQSMIFIEDNYDSELEIDEDSLAQITLFSTANTSTYTLTATDQSGNVGKLEVSIEFIEEVKEPSNEEDTTKPDSNTSGNNSNNTNNNSNNNGNSNNTTVETKPTSITVSPSTLSLEVGKTSKVTPTVAPSNATIKNVTYASENTNVATVDSNGTITAKGNGTTRIVVTASGNTSIKGYVSVTVTTPTVTQPTPEKDPLDHSLWTMQEMLDTLRFQSTWDNTVYTVHNVKWGFQYYDVGAYYYGGLKVVANPHQLNLDKNFTGNGRYDQYLETFFEVATNSATLDGKFSTRVSIGNGVETTWEGMLDFYHPGWRDL